MANAINRPATFGLKTKSGAGDEAAERFAYSVVQAGLHVAGVNLVPREAREVDSAAWPAHVQPGDHVAINTAPAAGIMRDAIWHHVIYVGDGKLVHMHPNSDLCEVEVDSYMASIEAAGDSVISVRVIQYNDDSDEKRAETVRRARKMLKKQADAPIRYNVLVSNCECFASYCRTGRWESEQVKQLFCTLGRVLHVGYQWWAGRRAAARGAGGDGVPKETLLVLPGAGLMKAGGYIIGGPTGGLLADAATTPSTAAAGLGYEMSKAASAAGANSTTVAAIKEANEINTDFKELRSVDGRFKFVMQDDRNIVLYKHDNPIWASNTWEANARGGYRLVIQADGNFVAYEPGGKPFWASNTWRCGPGPYSVVMQNDGDCVLYDSKGKQHWATNTGGR